MSSTSFLNPSASAFVAGAADQTTPAAGSVTNSAGGQSQLVSPLDQLRRFLILGSTDSFYASKATIEAGVAQRMIEELDGLEAVAEIVAVSDGGRAPKQGPAIFALALCARLGDAETKKVAYAALPKVCRIPTHLFEFVGQCESLGESSGWGRAHRRAVGGWYLQKAPLRLAEALTKYKQRDGWSHRDVLRLCHAKPGGDATMQFLFRYATKGIAEAMSKGVPTEVAAVADYCGAVEEAKGATTAAQICDLIVEHGLVREHVPTELLNEPAVWSTLLMAGRGMPMTAMLRNLAKMTSLDLFSGEGSEAASFVVAQLGSAEALRKARIHPFSVLMALKVYEKGHGDKGSLSWTPDPRIAAALDAAFYLAFASVQPTGKRFCVALDVSGSMGAYDVVGCGMNAREASAAMAMVTLGTEQWCDTVAFTSGRHGDYARSGPVTPFALRKDMTLREANDLMAGQRFGGTDCAVPMIDAAKRGAKYDVFVVYTDCETWAGAIHADEALRRYRKSSGIADAKLIVVGMTANKFTIADPADRGMLDVAGFDSAVPSIMSAFAQGLI